MDDAITGGIIKLGFAFMMTMFIMFGIPIITAVIGINNKSAGWKTFSQIYSIILSLIVFLSMLGSKPKEAGLYFLLLLMALLPWLLIQLNKGR